MIKAKYPKNRAKISLLIVSGKTNADGKSDTFRNEIAKGATTGDAEDESDRDDQGFAGEGAGARGHCRTTEHHAQDGQQIHGSGSL